MASAEPVAEVELLIFSDTAEKVIRTAYHDNREVREKFGFTEPANLDPKFFKCCFDRLCINRVCSFPGYRYKRYEHHCPVRAPLIELDKADKRCLRSWLVKRKGKTDILYSDWFLNRLLVNDLRLFACFSHFFMGRGASRTQLSVDQVLSNEGPRPSSYWIGFSYLGRRPGRKDLSSLEFDWQMEVMGEEPAQEAKSVAQDEGQEPDQSQPEVPGEESILVQCLNRG